METPLELGFERAHLVANAQVLQVELAPFFLTRAARRPHCVPGLGEFEHRLREVRHEVGDFVFEFVELSLGVEDARRRESLHPTLSS